SGSSSNQEIERGRQSGIGKVRGRSPQNQSILPFHRHAGDTLQIARSMCNLARLSGVRGSSHGLEATLVSTPSNDHNMLWWKRLWHGRAVTCALREHSACHLTW